MSKKTLIFWLALGLMTMNLAVAVAESDPPTHKIPLSRARVIALHKAPGKVKDFEFEIKNHKWVYFFKIAGKDQKWHFISVDAVTGKIASKSAAPMPAKSNASAVPTPTGTFSTPK